MAKSRLRNRDRMLVGRHREREILDNTLASPEAELVALYGRRRVGKTYLVREHVEPQADVFLMATGLRDGTTADQLLHFQREVERVLFDNAPLPRMTTWREAFDVLAHGIARLVDQRQPRSLVVFLDELPWLATPRSGLLQALDHAWNTQLSRVPCVRMILCGSAAAWMLEKLIHAKGGLHNRITRRIHLQPFRLREAKAFFDARNIRLSSVEIMDLYMAMGGVPHYLRQVERGRSAHENIALACFSEHGVLRDEFERLFSSLFRNSDDHRAIVRALASKRRGLARSEILELAKLSSGGRFAARLRELEQAGFISAVQPYRAKSKNTLHRLTDEFSLFYLTWIQTAPKGIFGTAGTSYWLAKSEGTSFKTWAGYTFESLCLKHAIEIRRALGTEAIACEVASWRHVPRTTSTRTEGAQIDLLFDRADGVINLCELKYAKEPFVVDKRYAHTLKTKLEIFQARTSTKKRMVLTLVTPYGLKANAWSEGLIERVVTADALLS